MRYKLIDHLPTISRVMPALRKQSLRVVDMPNRTVAKKSQSKRATLPARCVDGIDPGCVQALYNFPTAPASAPNNSLAVSGFINEIANQTDLTVRLFRSSRSYRLPLT